MRQRFNKVKIICSFPSLICFSPTASNLKVQTAKQAKDSATDERSKSRECLHTMPYKEEEDEEENKVKPSEIQGLQDGIRLISRAKLRNLFCCSDLLQSTAKFFLQRTCSQCNKSLLQV